MPPPPPSTVAAPPAPPPTAPAESHRRNLLVALVSGVAAVVLLTVVISLAGSSEPPPATGAAALVPSDALVYVHLSTDPARPAVRRALSLLRRLPDHGAALAAIPQRIVDVVGGRPGTTLAPIRPWLGREAAFALLNTSGGSAGSLIILDVRSRAAATAYLTHQGATTATGIPGATAVYQYPTGAELAFVSHYLVVGADADVGSAMAADRGRLASLASNRTYRRATAEAPAGRVLDAYASAGGVLRVLDSRSGFLGALGSLISPPSLLGVEFTVAAQSPGLVVHVHTVLDHATAAADTKRLESFHPTLAGVLPAGSTLMIDARNLSAIAPIVFGAIGKLGLYSQVPELLHRLGGAMLAQGVSPKSLLDVFHGETAVALARGTGAPALVMVTRTTNELAAREAMANAAGAIAQVFAGVNGGSAVASPITDVPVAGVTAQQIALSPGLQLDYVVDKGLVIVSTSTRGIADVVARSGQLDHSSAYGAVLGNRPDQVTSLGFADFSQLLSLGEQSQLASSAGYRSLIPELQRVRAVGIDSTRGEDDTTAELFLQIP